MQGRITAGPGVVQCGGGHAGAEWVPGHGRSGGFLRRCEGGTTRKRLISGAPVLAINGALQVRHYHHAISMSPGAPLLCLPGGHIYLVLWVTNGALLDSAPLVCLLQCATKVLCGAPLV